MFSEKMIITIVLALLIISAWPLIVAIRAQEKYNCDNRLTKIYSGERTKITPINENDKNYKYRLRDYYIKSSYNSCSCGDFSNGYVSIKALKELIAQGVRMFDLEIYSVNEKAVVAASNDDNFHIKGTLNSLPILDVFKVLRENACNKVTRAEICPNPTDPLFIHLRIKSNKNDIYNKVANALKLVFSNNLLSNYNKKYAFECNGFSLGKEGLPILKNKVIIMCDKQHLPRQLKEVVNMNSSGDHLRYLRHSKAIQGDITDLRTYNKKYMSIIVPDYNPLAVNSNNWETHHNNGCQFVCMNFQTNDAAMNNYNSKFNDKLSAFILKPDDLRYKITFVPIPKPPNPQLSYGERGINMRQFQGTM